ncbi:allene oxide synthase-lipoxygenase protein-like isoform X2 [Tachypleus tridentatus]|uniref:allene oxide synthase-lipoxygenase protein-like isoform X2 n=1 Tax=Tachypleus tridentatus TaxID=6853 RepID=UPI003FD18F7C
MFRRLKMDNILCSFSTPQFEVHVVTGDRRGAGTDANVWLVIHDDLGRKSPSVKLNKWWRNDHERDTESVYEVTVSERFGPVSQIEFWRDAVGFGDDWFVDRFEVHNVSTKEVYYFPVHRWVAADVHYFINEYDCTLPRDDRNKEQRQAELNRIREEYQIKVHVPGGPAQSWKLPQDEMFKGDYKWDIMKTKGNLLLTTSLINLVSKDKWKSLEDLKSIYKFSLEEPKCVKYWTEDKWFGLQRVQGANPVLISLCTEIPSKFGVEPEMVEPFLEGLTLEKALSQKRLFIVDLEILKDISCRDARLLTAPLALFFLNDRKELMPIAIQLFQDKGPDNPVFLPSDSKYTWLLAKLYYNNADASYHQSCTHLGFTHLLMEGVVVCTHRNLSLSHPLFKLMAPHFLYLLAINGRELGSLLSENGWVDTTMTVGRCGMFELVKRGFKKWQVDVNGIIPNDFKARNGVPGQDVKFTTVEQVTDMVTVVIAICSIGHAAANFLQYEEYGFPPNYPGILPSEVPKDKGPHTLQDVLKVLPDKETSLDIMVITKLLSRLGTKPLGDFEVKYLYHPVCVKAAEKFRAELKDITANIQARNESAEFPYPWLDPRIIPNSISI